MIEVEKISKIYGPKSTGYRALDSVSIDIRQNEFFTLLGPSGCGKTTLLRTIAGFESPTNGDIRLNGESLVALPPHRRSVNTVFQSYALFPHMNVAKNIGFGLTMLGKPKTEIDATVARMLDLVRLSDLADRQVSQLSGGQQQRVALARALAPHPKLLLLDEPLSALDLKLRKEMQLELKRLQADTGITFIFVTHDQEEALTMSDRVAVMSHGTVRQIGPPKEIYNRPTERFVADFIGETNFLKVEIVGSVGEDIQVRLPSGAIVRTRGADMSASSGAATLVVRPEQATLCAPEVGVFQGELRQVVYSGTDTHFHVVLDTEALFIVRQQNARPELATGMVVDGRVGIAVPDVAGFLLKD
ncbi:ABC transporter ATP-binding protein [Rhizobium sp. KVB221]|uniref:Spermidine/putrescine import ATP-binding protein PotA n=1 Tax=Rhizobium setariae TaxID=2801340 RepID=A0A937CKM2_9HYPH|nr:ABC transporter ATP-binding protein [Rhizobium setariae]MBL0372290.1 ABC transporter ATP-binding protein [Rhizobium setariae]